MAFSVEIKVAPSSGVQKIIYDKKGAVKCYLKSPPERGEANRELIAMLAKLLKITQSEISIIRGQTSRLKLVKIERDVTKELFLEKIGLVPVAQQTTLW